MRNEIGRRGSREAGASAEECELALSRHLLVHYQDIPARKASRLRRERPYQAPRRTQVGQARREVVDPLERRSATSQEKPRNTESDQSHFQMLHQGHIVARHVLVPDGGADPPLSTHFPRSTPAVFQPGQLRKQRTVSTTS
jgi:hypothetical protein